MRSGPDASRGVSSYLSTRHILERLMPKPKCEFKTTNGKQCKRVAAKDGLCAQHAAEFQFDDSMCRVFGCEKAVAAKGKCITHYQRDRRRKQSKGGGVLATSEAVMEKGKYSHLVKSTVDEETNAAIDKAAKSRAVGRWTIVREALQAWAGKHA